MALARHKYTRVPMQLPFPCGVRQSQVSISGVDDSGDYGLFVCFVPPWPFDKLTMYGYLSASTVGLFTPFLLVKQHSSSADAWATGSLGAGAGTSGLSSAGWASATATFTQQSVGAPYWARLYKNSGGAPSGTYVGTSWVALSNNKDNRGALGQADYYGGTYDDSGGSTILTSATGPAAIVLKIEDTSSGRSAILGNPYAGQENLGAFTAPTWRGVRVKIPFDCYVNPWRMASTTGSGAYDRFAIYTTGGTLLHEHIHGSNYIGHRSTANVEGSDGSDLGVKLSADTSYDCVTKKTGLDFAPIIATMGAGTIPADVDHCRPPFIEGYVGGATPGSLTLSTQKIDAIGFAISDFLTAGLGPGFPSSRLVA